MLIFFLNLNKVFFIKRHQVTRPRPERSRIKNPSPVLLSTAVTDLQYSEMGQGHMKPSAA